MNVNLLKWEGESNCLAPLTTKERDSIIELTSATFWRPLNANVLNSSRQSCIKEYRPNNKVEEYETKSIDDNGKKCFKKEEFKFMSFNESNTPISSSHQFLSLYAVVEEGMEREQDISYHYYIKQLEGHRNECQILLNQLNQALNNLQGLADQYTSVSTKTSTLHTDCEHLLAEQTRLSNGADTIENKFSYFIEVNNISKKLNSPAFQVTNDNFIPLLTKIDECLSYMNSNPTYLESSTFHAKYKMCLNRSLSMVKHYVTKSLEKSTSEVCPQLESEKKTNADNATILYYSKFRTNAPRIKALMSEIEDRMEDSSEYKCLLNDCHQCYFKQRKFLIEPCVMDAVKQLTLKYSHDCCSLCRSGCAFLVHVCEDEYSLYHQFFSVSSTELESFLQSLCSILYDVLRPVIIHIDHLETLSELCIILRKGMIEEHIQNNPVQLAPLATVVNQLLEDCQERLVYRAHIYIQSDIANFHPSPGDLAYPAKLQLMENIADLLISQSQSSELSAKHKNDSVSSETSIRSSASDELKSYNAAIGLRFSRVGSSPADLHGMWYPTVRRTLMCLSKVYRCMDRNVFQGLSLEALSACMQSLSNAASTIKEKSSCLDAQLFEIKHLLILREQLTPFQVDASMREMALDWSKLRTAAMGLVHKRGRLFSLTSNNSLLEFIVEGTPQVTEHVLDSKRNVDNQLKIICEQFISTSTETLIGVILKFEEKVNIFLQMVNNDLNPVLVKNQPFSSPEKVADLVSLVQKDIRKHIPIIHKSLQLYLANKDTEFILFKPVRNNIISAFNKLRQLLEVHYSDEDRGIIACPSHDEIVVWLSSFF